MEIENEAIEKNEPVEVAHEEVAEKPVSTREALTEALKSAKEKDEKEVTQPKAEKKEKPVNKAVVAPDTDAKASAPTATKEAPQGWSSPARGEFAKLPPLIQQEVLRREDDFSKKITQQDDDRKLGQGMKETLNPYMHIITAEGGTPITAVKELLNSAYILRRGTPQQKAQLILNTAKQFGVDLGVTQQPQGNELHAANQQIAQLKQRLDQWENTEKQKGEATVQSQIKTFASDPKHPHFEQVQGHMAALLQGGVAKDLEDAYEQAVWARPELRSTLLAEQDEQRKASDTAKAQAARKAGSSVAGSPGKAASAPANKNLSTRDAIKAAMAEVRGTS